MKELVDSCKKAIAENRCLGCTALGDENFVGNYNCKYSKTQTAEESIKQIKLNLRNGEKMKYKFEIPERLPSLNEYINKINRNRYAGNKFKKDIQSKIGWYIKKDLGNLKIELPVIIHITWVEQNKRRDVDNVYSAVKYIQDSLVEMRVLQNDNKKHVVNVLNEIRYSNKSKVIVELEEINNDKGTRRSNKKSAKQKKQIC